MTAASPIRRRHPIARLRARGRLLWRTRSPGARAAVLMLSGSLVFSIMGALVKLLGGEIDALQITFFRCFFGFAATLPFILRKRGHAAFRTTHPIGHLLRGVLGVAAMVGSFYATTRLPLALSTAISFTSPLFMIVTALVVLGEKVRWRRGVATAVGFLGVLIMVRPGSAPPDAPAAAGLIGAAVGALSITLVKRLSATESALTILVYFGLTSSLLAAIPAYFVWVVPSRAELAMLALVGGLGALGQYCQVRAFALGELTAVAPIDYSRLVFAGILGFLIFAELPDRYTVLGALVIVGASFYIARREAQLSRLNRATLAAQSAIPHPEETPPAPG